MKVCELVELLQNQDQNAELRIDICAWGTYEPVRLLYSDRGLVVLSDDDDNCDGFVEMGGVLERGIARDAASSPPSRIRELLE